jgi:hypothetical protein
VARCGLRVRNECLPAHLFGKRKEGPWQVEPSQQGGSRNCALSGTTQVKSLCAQPLHLCMADSLPRLWLHAVICCHNDDCNVCHTGTASTHSAEGLVTCMAHGMMSAREVTL